jgi:hypothetical protein
MNRSYQYKQRKPNDDTLMYAFIGIVLIGVGIQMKIIKIPGRNVKQTTRRKSQRVTSDEASPVSSGETPGDKLDAIPCPYDCSSIPGSSCVNGKCTDPYLQL